MKVMGCFKRIGAKIFAKIVYNNAQKWITNPFKYQEKIFNQLIEIGRLTQFGRDHNFQNIKTYEDFKKQVPIRDYEGLKLYVERILKGDKDILWRGQPLYLAKTSGTTSGVKYIPLTKESLPEHIKSTRNAILFYIAQGGDARIIDGKMIFLQGSPVLLNKNGVAIGRLSGIVAHYVPKYLQKNRLPSWKTNCIDNWEKKVDAIVEETYDEKMTVIGGIPPWVQMYFEKLSQKSEKRIGDLFENFQLFIYGGVNYEPYKKLFENLIGRSIDSIELFPASEGFFAFQDNPNEKGMLLQVNSGMFFEFVKLSDYQSNSFERITIENVKLAVDYVLIVSGTSGLWAYNVGDVIRFTSLKPFRVIVSGRVEHFISAFGEHVIAKEVEQAIEKTCQKTEVLVREFTVAPQVSPLEKGLPYHEWFIEFEEDNIDEFNFALELNKEMCRQNIYYKDLIEGNILKPLVIRKIKKQGFNMYMKRIGKLGGQNKIKRLSNDRHLMNNKNFEDLINKIN